MILIENSEIHKCLLVWFERASTVYRNDIICFYVGRGVLQALVEKHFPAPDRNRIHRLLGLDPPRKSDLGKISNNGDADGEAGGSSGKRKPGTVSLPSDFMNI